MRRVAIVPARGGSKRIPRKNIRLFLGTPMLGRLIAKLKAMKFFDLIVVTTDDETISAVASDYDADVIIPRPTSLSNDHIPTQPVIQHAIRELLLHPCCYVFCIYPCNPLLKRIRLNQCLDQILPDQQIFSFPVLKYRHPIQRAFQKNDKTHELLLINPSFALSRTQDLESRYHDAGSFYVATAKTWLSNSRIHQNARGVEVSPFEAIDIDSEADWLLAEQLATIQDKHYD